MDFLKTLLAYMALLATLGVQEGPAPANVPTPTPLPAHMTATPEPHQTAAPTATPAPTPDPTPTMTANKRYTQLQFGDSGAQVKKLQNALIALGYMEKGSADGQYGYQTYNAVKAFQRANGLSADGVAGPKTLTVLYESPYVVGVSTPTVVPTATPTPSLPPMPTPNSSSAAQPTATASSATPAAAPPAASEAPADASAVLTRLEGAYIISGTTGETLYYETLLDGQPALVKPDLWINAQGNPVFSISQLTDCMDGWTLMGSSADGLYALTACGYTVSIHVRADSVAVLVDGEAVVIPMEDIFLQDDVLYVSDCFLRTTLKADTIFDADENSLIIFFKDKSMANAQD